MTSISIIKLPLKRCQACPKIFSKDSFEKPDGRTYSNVFCGHSYCIVDCGDDKNTGSKVISVFFKSDSMSFATKNSFTQLMQRNSEKKLVIIFGTTGPDRIRVKRS